MLPLPVPASVYGLVLLLAALNFGFVKLDDVKEVGIYLTGIFPLLFVVNFDHISADLAINIPSHAFDFLQIPQMDQYKATELLSGKEENISLLPYKATNVAVEGYGGKILKIKL